MNYSNLQNKSIALLIWNIEKVDDAHVYPGQIVQVGNELQFINESKGWRVRLSEEQMARVKPVSAKTKEVFLQADYFISVTMGRLPDDNAEDF